MNKEHIKAELRRSAKLSGYPSDFLSLSALIDVVYYSDWPRVPLKYEKTDDMRIFLLLVAEAL